MELSNIFEPFRNPELLGPENLMKVCDESRCVSRGTSEQFGGSFTCYGNDQVGPYPMMCADGYTPRKIDAEPPQTYMDEEGDIPLWYYTCCPPMTDESIDFQAVPLLRHCSDPVIVDDWLKDDYGLMFDRWDDDIVFYPSESNETEQAGTLEDIFQTIEENKIKKTGNDTEDFCKIRNGNRTYPRKMSSRYDWDWDLYKYKLIADSILCCDSEIAINENINATVAECVPYENAFTYDPTRTRKNWYYFRLDEFCGGSWNHPYTHPLAGETYKDIRTLGRFQCCQTPDPDMPITARASFLPITYIAIYGLVAFISTIVTISLLIPLLLQWKSRGGHNGQRSKTKRRSSTEASYSTYNLYLVYIAITDLFFALMNILWRVVVDLQGKREKLPFFETVYLFVYNTANFSINAIICYQIWVLLQSTQQGKRIDPPSLTRVNLQSWSAYSVAVIVGVLTYYADYLPEKGYSHGALSKASWVLYLLTLALPAIYILGVSGLIWYRGYLRSKRGGKSVKDRGTRALALFFFRIVWIFLLFFIPGTLLNIFWHHPWAEVIYYVLFALQAIVTACCVLTKPDCKKYVVDFITLSYLRSGANCCGSRSKASPDTSDTPTTSQTAGISMGSSKTSIKRNEDSLEENNNPGDDSCVKQNDVSAWDAAPAIQQLPSMEDDNDEDENEEIDTIEDDAAICGDTNPV